MGDIKKQKKKFSSPSHPWQKARIDEEIVLLKEYGLSNKRGIWKMHSILKKFYAQAKKLTITQTKQSEVERVQLLTKLKSLALLNDDAKLEDVLTITINDIMNRRLQTLVFKKNLARSTKQARQFITHNHVYIGGKNITMPSYLVNKEEESLIAFGAGSPLSNPDHPERVVVEQEPVKPKKEKKADDKKKTKKKEDKKKTKPKKADDKKKTKKKEDKKAEKEEAKEEPKEEAKGEK